LTAPELDHLLQRKKMTQSLVAIVLVSFVCSALFSFIQFSVSKTELIAWHQKNKEAYIYQIKKSLYAYLDQPKYWQNIDTFMTEDHQEADLVGYIVGDANGQSKVTRIFKNDTMQPLYQYLERIATKAQNSPKHPQETEMIGQHLFTTVSLEKGEHAPRLGYLIAVWQLEPIIKTAQIHSYILFTAFFLLLSLLGATIYWLLEKWHQTEKHRLKENLQIAQERIKQYALAEHALTTAPLSPSPEALLNTHPIIDPPELDKSKKIYHFLEVVSEEMKIPLQTILGFCGILSKQINDQQSKKHIEKINISALVLMDTLNDLNDFSAIENKHFQTKEQSFDPRDQYEQITDIFSHVLRSKDIQLWVSFAPSVMTPLKGDANRLKQILINLLSYFLKLCESGHFFVHVHMLGKTQNRLSLKTTIDIYSDQAISGDLPSMQQKLKQTLNDGDRCNFQSNLGLDLSFRMIELLRGEIKFSQSDACQMKAEFTLKLQIYAEQTSNYHLEELQYLPLWIISTSTAVYHYFNEALLPYQVNLRILSSMAHIAQMPYSENKYPILIVDDKADSLAILAQLIEHHPSLQLSPIIVLDTFGRLESQTKKPKELQKLSNTLYFLELPIKQSKLHELLIDLAKAVPIDKPVQGGSLRQRDRLHRPLAGRRALIVDDSDVNQMLMIEILSEWGMLFATASHGKEAVDLLEKDSAFDYILMDLQMPVMNGIDATEKIKASPLYSRIPVIIITANDDSHLQERYRQLGIQHVLSKPIRAQLLMNTLLDSIDHTDQILRSGTQAETEASIDRVIATIEQEQQQEIEALSVLNIEEALELTSGKKELLEKILQMFVRDYGNAAQQIQQFLQAEDLESAERLAHSVKGCAATIAAGSVQKLSKEIEHAIAEEAPLPQIEIQIHLLEIELKKLCASIDSFVNSSI